MKKILAGLLSLGTLLGTSEVTFAKDKKEKVEVNKKSQNALLWKVSGNGLAKPSYVFGTVHVICKADYIWSDPMNKAFTASDKVVLEMDMDDPNLMKTIGMGMLNLDGSKLSDKFSSEDQEKLQKFLTKKHPELPLQAIDMMRPIAVYTMMMLDNMPCDSVKYYENELVDQAKNTKKEILGLELPKDQLELLLKIPEKEVVESISKMLNKESEKDAQDFAALQSAYKNQDLNKLANIINAESETSFDAETMLYNRNQNWIPKMEALMKDQSVFFAVGAGHLPGEQGVLNLLKKQGYKVEPVK